MTPAAEGANSDPEERRLQGDDIPSSEGKPPRKGFTLLFVTVGLLIIASTSVSTRITEIPVGAQFGVLELLPPSYWVGLSLMALSVILAVRCKSESLIVVTGALFFAVFAGTPVLFESNPPIWDAYQHLGGAQVIGFFGRLPEGILEYPKNWPGAFLVVSFLNALSSLGPFEMLGIFPFLTGGLTFLGLFVFLRWLLPVGPAVGGSLLGSFLNVWAQFHLSPQSVGLFLALLILATAWERRVPVRAASTMLFVGLVVTHPTSAILLLAILIVDTTLTHVRRIWRRGREVEVETEKAFAHSPALAFGSVWIAWLFFQATGSSRVAEVAILAQIGSILQIPEESLSLAAARSVENIFLLPPFIRLGSLLVYAIVGIVALGLLTRRAERRRLAQFFWAALIAVIVIAGADILLVQGLFFDRALMLAALLVPALCFAGLELPKRRRSIRGFIIAVLLVSSIASASTIYYQEVFYFVSDKSIAVTEHFQRVEGPSLVLGGLYPIPVWREPDRRATWTSLEFFKVYPESLEESPGNLSVYAVFDSGDQVWYRQWYGVGIYEFYEVSSLNHSMIYSNGQAEIYFITPRA